MSGDFPLTGDLAARCRSCGAKPGQWCTDDCQAPEPQHSPTPAPTTGDQRCSDHVGTYDSDVCRNCGHVVEGWE